MTVPLPDGVTAESLEKVDLEGLSITDPERAMIMADFKMKHHVGTEREVWIRQAITLYLVKELNLWQHHPEGYSSIFEWCLQPEIGIPASTASDMIAVARFSQEFNNIGIDLFQHIREHGHSKIRSLIPMIREAHRDGVLEEQVGPILDELGATSFRDVLAMVNPPGTRTAFDPEGVYHENTDGTFSLTLRNLSLDSLAMAANKLKLKRWYDENGRRIEPPINLIDKD